MVNKNTLSIEVYSVLHTIRVPAAKPKDRNVDIKAVPTKPAVNPIL